MPLTSMSKRQSLSAFSLFHPGANIVRYNAILADQMDALSGVKQVPADLSAVTEPSGDIYLRYADGKEAEFGVVGVICGECVVAPSAFPK